ncbi:hypothetical protein ACQEVZ_38675 [Dactylosporangium sp. CA-152071]|uniref:hypothetical protein n=1 Tax=Dactylosporangium sp. CA-152071 TaxID=3239933 RepID=UPI003D8FAE91
MPTLHEAIAAKMAASAVDDPEQLTRVAELAKTNPTAYADLPAGLRARAALHATTPHATTPPPAEAEGDQQ